MCFHIQMISTLFHSTLMVENKLWNQVENPCSSVARSWPQCLSGLDWDSLAGCGKAGSGTGMSKTRRPLPEQTGFSLKYFQTSNSKPWLRTQDLTEELWLIQYWFHPPKAYDLIIRKVINFCYRIAPLLEYWIISENSCLVWNLTFL